MIVNLVKKDFERLITSLHPSKKHMIYLANKGLGYLSDRKWEWRYNFSENFSEEELWDLYFWLTNRET